MYVDRGSRLMRWPGNPCPLVARGGK